MAIEFFQKVFKDAQNDVKALLNKVKFQIE